MTEQYSPLAPEAARDVYFLHTPSYRSSMDTLTVPERPFIPQAPSLEKEQLAGLRERSLKILDELVTDEGYFASTHNGLKGMYHNPFGRDTAIAFAFINECLRSKKDLEPREQDLLGRAINGFFSLDYYQAREDDPDIGKEKGKRAHEIRKAGYEHLTSRSQEDLERGERPWFVDGDGIMKNWDSADATPLDLILKGKLHDDKIFEPTPEQQVLIREELDWCLRNMKEHQGFAGFTYNPGRRFGGLLNQNWKDSAYTMLHEHDVVDARGRDPRKPFSRKPVEVNAFTWSALRYGADLFKDIDPSYADKLRQEADGHKKRFNDPNNGFLMKGSRTGLWYFAEALDEENNQVKNITADPLLALWATHQGESIIEDKYIPDVVKRGLQEDLFNPEAGMRTYSNLIKVHDEAGYHNGRETYWPHISGLVSVGLDKFGYKKEAEAVLKGSLARVDEFGSNVEMFIRTSEGKYVRWKDKHTGQETSEEQLWVAAMVLNGTQRLLESKMAA